MTAARDKGYSNNREFSLARTSELHGRQEGGCSLDMDQEARMKKQNLKIHSKPDPKSGLIICDLDLEKDSPILCTPAGEKWRIASVDEENISFEKIS